MSAALTDLTALQRDDFEIKKMVVRSLLDMPGSYLHLKIFPGASILCLLNFTGNETVEIFKVFLR